MDNWIGDWMYDEEKLANLTQERAIEDIWAMNDSPDYDRKDVSRGMKMAAKQLEIKREEMIALIQLNYHANKMS
jgi:hypothetical protein